MGFPNLLVICSLMLISLSNINIQEIISINSIGSELPVPEKNKKFPESERDIQFDSQTLHLPYIMKDYFSPIKVPVLILAYYPPDLNNPEFLNGVETGMINQRIADVKANVQQNANDVVEILSDVTRYHGYKQPNEPKFLEYFIFEQIDYFISMPRGYRLSWGPYRPNYGLIMREIDICNFVDQQGVKKVWIYGYHSDYIEPDESKMSSRYGDISNAWPKDEQIPEQYRLPRCENSYVMYNFNYSRLADTNLHNQMHQIENIISYADYDLFWNDFSELVFSNTKHNYVSSCGNGHYTPNWETPANDYEYWLMNYRMNNCETWHPDDSLTSYVNTNCQQWDCTQIGFNIWYMQNMPGYNNGIIYRGKAMRNWWEAMYDFNRFIDEGRTLFTDIQ